MATVVLSTRCFKGTQFVYKHQSKSLNCEMTFGMYVPDHKEGEKLATVFYLSGLTCTHANVMEKSGMQRVASEQRLIIVHPDTSPRNVNIEGEDESWDFGSGAGFYVDATVSPWSSHYKMYSYIAEEMPGVVAALQPVDTGKIGITGHSMGGHGALLLGLRNPSVFRSVSAFAPIAHPANCPWGQKAFNGYLGPDKSTWEQYDSSLLIKSYKGPARKILVDQGSADSFLRAGQLQPESLKSTEDVTVEVRMQPEYDHSYYFIATFIEDHLLHHKKELA